jgi:L-lactate utilization protein LutC
MSKLFENINLIKGFVNNKAIQQVAKADSLNQVYESIANIFPETVAAANEFQRQDRAFALEEDKLKQQKANDAKIMSLEEDKLVYEATKDIVDNSITSPSIDSSPVSMDLDVFKTDVFKEIAKKSNQRSKSDYDTAQTFNQDLQTYDNLSAEKGETNFDLLEKKSEELFKLENTLNLNFNPDSKYYKKMEETLQEKGDELVNEYGINFYETFIDKNAKSLGINEQDKQNLIMTFKQSKSPEQVKQAISTFLDNVQITKQLAAGELSTLVNLMGTISDPRFQALAPQAYTQLSELTMGLINKASQQGVSNPVVTDATAKTNLRVTMSQAPTVLTVKDLPANQLKVKLPDGNDKVRDFILAYNIKDNSYTLYDPQNNIKDVLSEDEALQVFNTRQ